jgi:23S rRNA G2445 N2-methylase RlmL
VFTSNDRLAREVRLRVARSTPFYNGSLACRLWEFAAPG